MAFRSGQKVIGTLYAHSPGLLIVLIGSDVEGWEGRAALAVMAAWADTAAAVGQQADSVGGGSMAAEGWWEGMG